MLWTKVWIYLYKARTIASRLDKGSETGVVVALNALFSPTASWGSSGDSHVSTSIKYVYFFM